MTRNRSIKAELKQSFTGVYHACVFLEMANLAAIRFFDAPEDHTWPFIAGVGMVSFGRFCNHYLERNKPTITMGKTESRRRVMISGQQAFLSSVPLIGRLTRQRDTRTIKYRDPLLEVKTWHVDIPKRDETIEISEARLLALCEAGYRRQRSTRLSDAKYPLSRTYFTQSFLPRFSTPEYVACMTILARFNMLIGRSQGTSGRLRFRPVSTVEMIKELFVE